MNSKLTGNLTEMKCMSAFMELGHNVLIPFGDCERYDFVVNIENQFLRIQCKTSQSDDDGSSFFFRGRSSHRVKGHCVNEKYTKEEIDYFATIWDNHCYLIPVEECGSCKRLRLSPSINGQNRGVNHANDYELECMLNKIC